MLWKFINFLKMLYMSRYMIRTMALRELRSHYVGSLFGLLWAVIYPLTQVAIYSVVFGIFFKSKPPPNYGTDSFFLYLLCGLIPWQFFAQTVSAMSNVIVSNKNLIKKAVGFPVEILPIVTVISQVLSHLISVGLLLVILIVVKGNITLSTPIIFLYLFFISIFTVGLGWILASMNVYLRDTQHILGLIMMAWLYLTPIFYPYTIIPSKLLMIFKLNPMYHVVSGYRYSLLVGGLPLGWGFLYLAVISVVTFSLGGIFFRRLKLGFAEVF